LEFRCPYFLAVAFKQITYCFLKHVATVCEALAKFWGTKRTTVPTFMKLTSEQADNDIRGQ
jgi:hypothetical protein